MMLRLVEVLAVAVASEPESAYFLDGSEEAVALLQLNARIDYHKRGLIQAVDSEDVYTPCKVFGDWTYAPMKFDTKGEAEDDCSSMRGCRGIYEHMGMWKCLGDGGPGNREFAQDPARQITAVLVKGECDVDMGTNDDAAAVADPHMTTNTGQHFDYHEKELIQTRADSKEDDYTPCKVIGDWTYAPMKFDTQGEAEDDCSSMRGCRGIYEHMGMWKCLGDGGPGNREFAQDPARQITAVLVKGDCDVDMGTNDDAAADANCQYTEGQINGADYTQTFNTEGEAKESCNAAGGCLGVWARVGSGEWMPLTSGGRGLTWRQSVPNKSVLSVQLKGEGCQQDAAAAVGDPHMSLNTGTKEDLCCEGGLCKPCP